MSDYYQFRDETGTPIDYYQLVNDNNELCKEIERLNNIIEKYKKHLKEYDEWLDYNTKIGNLYWYDATPFPKLELKGSDKE